MKKTILTITAIAALALSSKASVSIDISIGSMFSGLTSASNPFPSSGRLNLLALDSGTWGNSSAIAATFGNLTSSFTPAGSTLIASFDASNNFGVGTVSYALSGYSYAGSVGAGDQLLLVGYPTLTLSSSSPGQGTTGFIFRSDTVGGDGNPPNIAFVLPADGTTTQLWFEEVTLTSGNGATGGSNGWSGFTTVPEPSTYALMALGGLVLFFIARRRKVQA